MSDLVENHTLMDSLDDLMQSVTIDENELREKEKRIRKLSTILRNEENKLTLMKKIRQSQSQAIQQQRSTPPAHSHSHHQSTPPAHSHSIYNTPPAHSHHHQTPALAAHQHAHVQQPPIIRAAHQSRSTTVLNPPITNNRSVNSYGVHPPPPLGLPSHRTSALSAPVIRGPPTSHHHQSLLRPGYHSLNRTPVTTPPNVVLGYPVQDLRAQQSLTHTQNQVKPVRQSDIQVPSNACASPLTNEINQNPAQRLAAAKAALKKQLEKTLLQIVPPKPPSDMHFIPNANNNEFIYYYGLETIVDFLTGTDQNKSPPEPFECAQCNTDFTPLWKWQDGADPSKGKPAVCESCISSSIKEKMRDEHTKRLKSAFVKALQQEQEIERKISSGAPSPPVPALTPPNNSTNNSHLSNPLGNSHGFGNSSVLPQAPPAHSSFPRHGSSSAAAAAAASATASAAALAASALFNIPKLTPAQQSLFQAQLQTLAQSLNPQALSQPQPAHMLPFAPLLYQYGALMNNNDINNVHRQYLLDMIPPRSLGP